MPTLTKKEGRYVTSSGIARKKQTHKSWSLHLTAVNMKEIHCDPAGTVGSKAELYERIEITSTFVLHYSK